MSTHFAPRIDTILYQAEVPDYPADGEGSSITYNLDAEEESMAKVNWFRGSTNISSTSPEALKSIKEFLAITRNIFEPTGYERSDHWSASPYGEDSNPFDIPLESDARAIEYLANYDYDVKKACFHLFVSMGCGKDGVSTTVTANMVDRSSNGVAFTDNQDRVFRAGKMMLGSYGSFPSRSATAGDDRMNGSSMTHAYGYMHPRRSLVSTSEDDATVMDQIDAMDDMDKKDANDTLYLASGRAARAADKDKVELKKRWNNIYDKGTTFRRNNYFPISDAQAILDEASNMNSYVNSPGDDLGDKLKVFLGELAKDVMKAREWIAEMRDRLYSKRDCHAADVTKLIASGKTLKVCPVEDIDMLQKLVDDAEYLSAPVKKILKRPAMKPSLEDLSELLRQITVQCVTIPEYNDLLKLYEATQEMFDKVKRFLVAADVSASLKPSTTSKGKDVLNSKVRIELSDAQQLLASAQNYMVVIPKLARLQEVVDAGIAWRHEVSVLTETNKAVSMRRVDALLSMADALPFSFAQDVEKLREKKSHAKLWLEKMKKSFSLKASEQSSRAKASSEFGEGDDRRIGLQDMKMMVEEGQLLLESTEDGSEGASSSKTHSRELQRAQSIVDMADNWMERVKDMLQTDILSSSYDNSSLGSPSKGEEEMNRFVSELRDMLREADSMPVVMDEMLVLRMQVQALDWAKKMRPVLQQLPSTRLSDIQKHYRDISRIRDSLPDGVAEDYPAANRLLPEEVACREIIARVEGWLDQLKKVTQSNTVRKGVSLDKILEVLRNSQDIEVNIDQELKPLRTALTQSTTWLQKNVAFLQSVEAIPMDGNTSTTSIYQQLIQQPHMQALWKLKVTNRNDEEDEESEEDQPNDEMEMGVGETVAALIVVDSSVELASAHPVTYIQLSSVVSSASALTIDFDEVRVVRTIHSRIDSWKAKVEEALSSNFPAARSSRSKGSKTKRPANDSEQPNNHSNAANHRAALEYLLIEADDLRVEVSAEKQRITNVLTLSRNWDATAKSKLDELNEEDSCSALNDAISAIFRLEPSALQNYSFLRGVQTEIEVDLQRSWEQVFEEIFLSTGSNNTMIVTKKSKDGSSYEDVMEEMQQIADELSHLLEEADMKGMVSSTTNLLVRLSVACIQWGMAVRDYLRVSFDQTDRAHKKKLGWGDLNLSLAEEFAVAFNSFDLLVNDDDNTGDMEDEDKLVESNAWRDAIGEMSAKTSAAMDVMASLLSKRSMMKVTGAEEGSEEGAHKDDMESDSDMPPTSTSANQKQKSARSSSNKAVAAASAAAVQPIPPLLSQPVGKKAKTPIGSKVSQRIKDKNDTDIDGQDIKAEGADDEEDDMSSSANIPKNITRILRNLHTLCQQYHDLIAQDSACSLPRAVMLFLTGWRAMLDLYLLRRREVQMWSDRKHKLVARSMNSIANSTGKNCHDDVSTMLQIAKLRGIECADHKELEQLVQAAITWQRSAQGMLTRDKNTPLLSIDNLKAFIRQGEQLIFDLPEVSSLRAELKKAKQWKIRIDRLGDKLLQADDADINDLVTEAQDICVDLSEHLLTVTEAKLKYCLCRQEYHSEMVGCDTCKEWYHCACIGISKSMADKLDSFSCIRCTLVTSFENSAVTAAQTVNRWMIPENVARWRDQAVTKLQKRVLKEGKDVHRLESQLYEALKMNQQQQHHLAYQQNRFAPSVANALDPPQSLSSITDSNFLELISSTSSAQTAELPEHIKRMKNELEEARKRLARSREEADAKNRRSVDDHMLEDCQDWMHVLQRVFWPSNRDEIAAGSPVGLSHFTPPTNKSVLFQPSSKNDDQLLKQMVPDAIRRAAEAAVALNIDKVDDVVETVEHFRWMSWCHVTLQILRAPLTTTGLRRLLESGRPMRFADERILKLLQHISSKSAGWKAKARKAISSRSLDLNKLTELVLEGNAIPINSRVKVALKEQLKRYQLQDSNRRGTAGDVTEELGTRRIAAISNRAISYTGFISLPVSAPDSSDDESPAPNVSTSSSSNTSTAVVSNVLYEDFPTSSLAVTSKELWPMAFTFTPLPRGNIKNMVPAVYPSTTSSISTSSISTTSLARPLATSLNKVMPGALSQALQAKQGQGFGVGGTYVATKAIQNATSRLASVSSTSTARHAPLMLRISREHTEPTATSSADAATAGNKRAADVSADDNLSSTNEPAGKKAKVADESSANGA